MRIRSSSTIQTPAHRTKRRRGSLDPPFPCAHFRAPNSPFMRAFRTRMPPDGPRAANVADHSGLKPKARASTFYRDLPILATQNRRVFSGCAPKSAARHRSRLDHRRGMTSPDNGRAPLSGSRSSQRATRKGDSVATSKSSTSLKGLRDQIHNSHNQYYGT